MRTVASGVEIERKFLPPAPPDRLEQYESASIAQGYVALDGDRAEVRVRLTSGRALLTIKGAGTLARVEEELELDERQFASLWPLTDGRRIEKVRYRIPLDGGLVAELDIYRGALAGLLTAEVEFSSEDAAAAFVAPEWLGHEVTGDGRYKNKRLATHGLPDRAG